MFSSSALLKFKIMKGEETKVLKISTLFATHFLKKKNPWIYGKKLNTDIKQLFLCNKKLTFSSRTEYNFDKDLIMSNTGKILVHIFFAIG